MVNLRKDSVLIIIKDNREHFVIPSDNDLPTFNSLYLNINNNTNYSLTSLRVFRIASLIIQTLILAAMFVYNID
jgi:hypothetical protein